MKQDSPTMYTTDKIVSLCDLNSRQLPSSIVIIEVKETVLENSLIVLWPERRI